MARAGSLLVLTLVLLGANAPMERVGVSPLFSVTVPLEMVVGRVSVKARATDQKVMSVKWTVDDWSRYTPAPFELTFDAGPVPYERRVTAVALDKDRRPLYRQEAVLNPGGRGLQLDFHNPVDGQRASGLLPVELRVRVPADDEPERVVLDLGSSEVPLAAERSGVYVGSVEVPSSATALVARLRTRRGREADRTILLNARGVLAESDVHVVEQLVGVSKGSEPIVNLTRSDFRVRDEKGDCEVRESSLLTNAPLSIGFAIDTSVSLRHSEELKQATANQFITQCIGEKDAAFLIAFGPAVVKVLDWTRSKESLKTSVLALFDSSVPGTALYEAIQKSLYQLQGQQGARALLLITDGHDFDGDVSLESALTYARQSGVKIYALGLTSSYEQVIPITEKGPDGEVKVVGNRRETIEQSSNVDVLSKFTAATGGRMYLVRKATDLQTIYQEIERDIRTQYLVSYVSTVRRRSAFHPVEVSTTRGKVHTAPGFFY